MTRSGLGAGAARPTDCGILSRAVKGAVVLQSCPEWSRCSVKAISASYKRLRAHLESPQLAILSVSDWRLPRSMGLRPSSRNKTSPERKNLLRVAKARHLGEGRHPAIHGRPLWQRASPFYGRLCASTSNQETTSPGYGLR